MKNASRLHYDPHELKRFERIECEWPLFFCYLILDGLFHENDYQVGYKSDLNFLRNFRFFFQVTLYCNLLDECIIRDPENVAIIPELYAVPADKVNIDSVSL